MYLILKSPDSRVQGYCDICCDFSHFFLKFNHLQIFEISTGKILSQTGKTQGKRIYEWGTQSNIMGFIGTLSLFCEGWYKILIIAVGVAVFSLIFFLGRGGGALVY